MIIELVGLPGAGKSTLARALEEKGAVVVGAPSKLRLIADTLAFESTYPLTALRLATNVVLRAPHGMRYSLYVNGYLLSASKFMRAKRLSKAGKTAVIDQGHAQLVISLLGLSSALLRALPKPDMLVLVEAARTLRQSRMQERGRTPREESGNAEQFDQDAEAALLRALPEFEQYPRLIRLNGEQPDMTSFETLPNATPIASFGKRLMLGIASLVSLVWPRNGAAVLMYHAVDTSGWRLSIPPAEFKRQMEYLKRTQNVVPLSDVVAYAKGEKQLPPLSVALTFDDGYHDLVVSVLPLIEKLRIPITLFLTTNLSEKTNSLALPRVSPEDIKRLTASGLVAIESHGRTHPHLPKLSSEAIAAELAGAASDLKSLGISSSYFAYPFGDRSPDVEHLVAHAGYTAAFSISEGFVHKGDDLLHLKRIQIDSTQTFSMFRARLTSALTINRALVDLVRPKKAS